MKNSGRVMVCLSIGLLLSVLFASAGSAWKQESGAKAPAPQAPAPGRAEMDRLKFYLGEWDYTENYNDGKVNTGLYTSKLGPGANSLINTFHSQGPMGEYEGVIVYTWDTKENAYKAYLFGNDFPGAVVQTGTWEGNDLVFRSEFSYGGHSMKLRYVTRLTADGKIESEDYVTPEGKPEKLFVKVVATKKK
jgi:hypothetical protein